MELIRPEDMEVWTPYAVSTPLKFFNPLLQVSKDSDLAPFISDEAVANILAFDRESATDQATALYQFWFNYVRPYIVLCVFVRLTQTHGYNMAANGIVKFTDRENTSAPIDRNERSDIAETYKGLRDRYLNKMLVEFEVKNQTFDGTVYEINRDKYKTRVPSPAGVNPIGSVNNAALQAGRKFRL